MEITDFFATATDAVKSVTGFITAFVGLLAILEKLVKKFFDDDDTDTDDDTRKG